jgi:hypothetical protein
MVAEAGRGMTRWLVAGAVLALAVTSSAPAWGQAGIWHVGASTPGALEGGFQEGGGVINFLVLGSPRNCNDGTIPGTCDNPAHIWFYDQTCTQVNHQAIAMKPNQVVLLPIGSVTPVTQGNFLVATAKTANPLQPIIAQPDPTGPFAAPSPPGTGASIIGELFVIDVVRGISRLEPLARLEHYYGWMRYRSEGALLLSLPDDRVSIIEDLLLRCPTGISLVNPALNDNVHATQGQLGGDMMELSHQARNTAPIGDAYLAAPTKPNTNETIWFRGGQTPATYNGLFATAVTATLYDPSGSVLGTASTPCQCFTSVPLSTVSPLAAAGQTYWEIVATDGTANFAGGKKGAFTGGVNMQVKQGGLNLNFFTPLFMSDRVGNIGP